MLGIPEVYVKGQFYYTPAELDRATNSSYKDYDKEIVLPSEEMEHVLTCVYSDIPAELTLPAEVHLILVLLLLLQFVQINQINIYLGYKVLHHSCQ